jgi:hypothetical protein
VPYHPGGRNGCDFVLVENTKHYQKWYHRPKPKVVRILDGRGHLSICVFVLYFVFVSKNATKKNGVLDENT